MSKAIKQLIKLSEQLAVHEGVTHWTISMRFFKKGDFFKNLTAKRDIRTATYEAALQKFTDAWPEDLAWPGDIPRPAPTQTEVRDAS